MARRIDREWRWIAAGLVLAGFGWDAHSTLLALAGMLGALAALMLWVWQRACLTAVSYRRTLGQQRAAFGEHVSLEVELVNDKLLPLSWLHVQDQVPPGLEIRGGAVAAARFASGELNHLLTMLPFQRVRRRFTVVCDQRGAHTFGPARLRSGDPIGLREQLAYAKAQDHLLVYPKLLALAGLPAASLLPLGDTRTARSLIDDPSRVAGVREYRSGDPLRHVDWRATARTGALLVREFEPSASPKVAVFLDTRLPTLASIDASRDVIEFAIALAASIVADLAGRGIATGLYASGAVEDRPIAQAPSSSPTALTTMLELLARTTTRGPVPIEELLIGEGARLGRGVSVIVVAAGFPDAMLVALTEVRRRAAVTAVWVATAHGEPPPRERLDEIRQVSYGVDWRDDEIIDLH
ncbi:MAG TPA: DUF58 domain-containing protein [Solirubrobacteraceae bacterium]